MKYIAVFIVYTLTFYTASASQTDTFFKQTDAFLSKYVQNGRVDYTSVQKNQEHLDNLLQLIADAKVTAMNDDTFKAFHINAYNLYVIKGILAKYPVNSPLDIKGFFDKTTYNIAGNSYTLNDIENKILRKKYPNEPRFHFALVCAGLGCPPIIPEAYTPQKLETQLQRQTKLAVNNPEFIKVKGNKVQLSQIFEWYKEDFVKKGNEVDFLNLYRIEKIPAKSKISYYSYDWKLNDVK